MPELHPMSSPERQERILALTAQQGRVTVAELCSHFDISAATARRDLDALEAQGKLQRVHGGAILARHVLPELPILRRSTEQTVVKKRIAQAAAELVKGGETVFLGSGSTMLALAEALKGLPELTVITNSLPVINALAGIDDITLIALGGMLRATELSFIGHITDQALQEVRADRVFIGIHAISVEEGLTNAYLPETLTDRAILRIGREIVLLADHTKCGRISTAFLAPLSSIHILVTDDQAPVDFITAMQDRGVQVIVA
jgi:DeoR/GlpR family transcriptional regulator of sugar metabolism